LKAVEAERVARAEYIRVVETFTALVIWGKVPEEPPS
jgi:hypothetical protein